MRHLLLVLVLALNACDSDSDVRVLSSGSGSGSGSSSGTQSGIGTVNSGSQSSSANYFSIMSTLIGRGDQLIKDYEDVLDIWNATYNIEYANSRTKEILLQVRSIISLAKILTPPDEQKKAHSTFIAAFSKFESALLNATKYFGSQGTDETALLNANINIQEFNRLLERYNQENG